MRRSARPRPVLAALAAFAALALVLTVSACSESPTGSSTGEAGNDAGGSGEDGREQALAFSACMRDNGVEDFPDPDPSAGLTIDAIANGTSVDTGSALFTAALDACADLTPAGFTGTERTVAQQAAALEFAQCVRDNGITDFPDPEPDGPLVDTNRIPSAEGRGALDIPGFTEATEACADLYDDELGLERG